MDRITQIRIGNVRAIENLVLSLAYPLTVLIGENGSGKSTIIECLELLRKAAEPNFIEQFYAQHRGISGLLRKGETHLRLGVRIEDIDGPRDPIDYDFKLRRQRDGAVIASEILLVGPIVAGRRPLTALRRDSATAKIFNQKAGRLEDVPDEDIDSDALLISSFGKRPPQQAIDRLLEVLRGIEIHVAFDTLAGWAAQSAQRTQTLRGTAMILPVDRLSLLGQNLAAAWSALKNVDETHWKHTMELVRLGLGNAIDSVNTVPDAGGGYVSLSIKRTDLPEPIPAANLSDGQLSWLSFVALARLNPQRSLLAFDEPELHLHPSLLGRVVSLLSNIEGSAPVLLSTHSDRVLELVDNPADAVRVCSLDGSKAVVAGIDQTELPRWLEQFGDLAQLRASGYLSRVLAEIPATTASSTESDP